MSAIGSGSIGGLNLAGSLAGAQSRDAETDRVKAESANQKFQVDQKTLSAQSLEDITQTGLSADRDADGRLPYDHEEIPEDDQETGGETEIETVIRSHRASDAFGECGTRLDLEA